jgi:Muconolactone delta-isomerase
MEGVQDPKCKFRLKTLFDEKGGGRVARYLVTGEYVDPGPMLSPQQVAQLIEQMVLPSLEALAKLEDQKKILGGGICAGARAGAFIVEVASNAELNRLLQELPFWGVVKWTSTPLLSFRERAADDKAGLERIKAMTR